MLGRHKVTADTRKSLVISLYVVATTAMVIAGKMDANIAFGSGSFLVGLLAGNGKNAIQGNTSRPVIEPKKKVPSKAVKKTVKQKASPTNGKSKSS